MRDLISREEVLDIIQRQIESVLDFSTHDVLIDCEYDVFAIPMVEVPQWIPCSERLPEEDKMSEYYESVIVTLDNGRVTTGCYRNMDEEWWVDAKDGEKHSMNATGHVIAWMPLPEPMKTME